MSNLEKLLKNLKDGDSSLKKLSIQTLAKQPFDQQIYDAVAASASTDPSQEVRYFARKALAFIEKKNGMERVETSTAGSPGAAPSSPSPSANEPAGPVARDAAVEAALRSADPRQVMAGLQAVANGRMTAMLPMVLNIMTGSDHPVVVASAAKIMGSLAGAQAIPGLVSLLDHQDPRVRANAVEGLGLTRSASAIPHVMKALKDQDNRVKANALTLLEKVGAVNVSRILDQMLASPTVSLRDSAVWAASRLKGREIGQVLVKALNNEESSELRLKIMEALAQREPQEILRGLSEFGESLAGAIEKNENTDPGVIKAFNGLLDALEGRGDELIADYVRGIRNRISKASAGSVPSMASQPQAPSPAVQAAPAQPSPAPAQPAPQLQAEETGGDAERKAKAMAAMLLVPMGTPQGAQEKKTNEWERIREILGDPVDPDSLPDDRRQEIGDFLGTIEVWRNNGYNVEPLFRALGRRADELEGIFDRYACLIQRCNKLATRFKRLDVSLFKDEVVDISLNLKNPTMVEELEIRVGDLENQVRDLKQDYVGRLERYKAGGFNVKNLEIAMIENLKTIKDEFDSFERQSGELLTLKEAIRPFRCKAFAERLTEVDALFGEAGNIPRIKAEIEKLGQEFEKHLERQREDVDRWEKYGLDTSQLKRAIAARDMDLIELQVDSLKESVRIIDDIERKFKLLDHEIFSDRLTELRKNIKNPAAIKGINFDLDELLKQQSEEQEALRALAEKWGQAGYDVSTLHASCSESLTWARKVFTDFRQENSLEDKLPELAGSRGTASGGKSIQPQSHTQGQASGSDAPSEPSLSQGSNAQQMTAAPALDAQEPDDDGMPPIEWWNLDFSILRDYLGEDLPEGAIVEDKPSQSGQAEAAPAQAEPAQDDSRVQKALEASQEMAEIYSSMSDAEKEAMERRNDDSFEKLKADDRGELDAAGREIFGKTEEEITSEDVYELEGLGGQNAGAMMGLERSSQDLSLDEGEEVSRITEEADLSDMDDPTSSEDHEAEIEEESGDSGSKGKKSKKAKKEKKPREPRKPLSPKAWVAIGVAAIILGTVFTIGAIRFYKVKYSPSYHIALAEEFVNQKNYRQAIESYGTALSIDADNSKAALGRVEAYVILGTSSSEMLTERENFLGLAEKEVESLVKSKDSDLKKAAGRIKKDLNSKLADLYLEVSAARKMSDKEKRALLDKALKLNPKGTKAQEVKCQMAEISLEQQDLDKAIDILEALLKEGSKLKKVPRQLAKAYFNLYKKEKDPHTGMKYLERAVELDPEPRYKTSLQNIYKELAESTSDLDDKIRILSNALALDDSNVLMRENLVELLHEKIRIAPSIDEKLECFKILEKHESDNANNFREVVRLTYDKALNTSDPKARLELLLYVRDNMENPDPGFQDHIKNTYLEIGDRVEDTDEKEKWYRKAYELTPQDKSVTRRLSKIYVKRGNLAEKFSSKELNYKNAQKYDPESQTVKLIYAALYYNRGVSSTETKEKIFNFEEALKIDEGFLEVYNNLALEYGKLGGNDNELKMVNYLNRAYSIDPTDETVKHNLALFFYNFAVRETDRNKKVQLYKKALEIDDTLEAARENHKLLTTKVFRVKDEEGNVVLKSASQMKIRERPEIQDYKSYGPVDMEYLMSLELDAERGI